MPMLQRPGVPSPGAPNAKLVQKIAALEAKLALLEKAIKVGQAGDVVIKATTMTIESSNPMTVKAPMINLQAASVINLKAAAKLDLKAGLITLN